MPRPNIAPFDVSDVEYFYASTYLQQLHRQRFRGHHDSLRACGTCGELAIHSLACLAGTARRRSRSRDEFFQDQRERGFGDESNPFPQTVLTTYVQRGFEMLLPATGRVAKPGRAARGSKFAAAFQAAHNAGAISVPVEIAHHLLEHVIRVVQADGEPRTEAGRPLPFGYIAHRVHEAVVYEVGLATGRDVLGDWSSETAELAWQQIVTACEGTGAEAELDKHVFRHSAQLSTACVAAASDDEHARLDDLADDLADALDCDDAPTTTGDGPSPEAALGDAVHQWARRAVDDVRDPTRPLDDVASATDRVLADALDQIGFTTKDLASMFGDEHGDGLVDLRTEIVRQATRILVWDDALGSAVADLRGCGGRPDEDLDLVVEVLYGLLQERDYPFDEEERDWGDPAVRRVALRGWARQIADLAHR